MIPLDRGKLKSYEERKNVDNNFLVGATLTDLAKGSTAYHTIW